MKKKFSIASVNYNQIGSYELLQFTHYCCFLAALMNIPYIYKHVCTIHVTIGGKSFV